MAKQKNTDKKQLRKEVQETLTSTFSNLKARMRSKVFERNIKKAAKTLLIDIKSNRQKKTEANDQPRKVRQLKETQPQPSSPDQNGQELKEVQ